MNSHNTGDRVYATLAELYPDLNRITLFVAFEEADAESEPNYQQIIFTAANEAVFRLDCSRDDCEGGGFDFAPVIAAMEVEQGAMAHGRINCAGTLKPEGSCCSLQAEFRIIFG